MNTLMFVYVFVLLCVSMAFDWLVQTYWESSNKFTESLPRAIHSVIYSCLTIILLYIFGIPGPILPFVWLILMSTHYMIDSRKPVIWWMIHVKRIPKAQVLPGPNGEIPPTWWLNIAIDQWFHTIVNFALAIVIAFVM